METLMQKRLKQNQESYDAQWDNGKGSHHPDYDPNVTGVDAVKVWCCCRDDECSKKMNPVLAVRMRYQACSLRLVSRLAVPSATGHGLSMRCQRLAVHV